MDVSIVVLAGPDKASLTLQGLGHHIIYESVLIPDLLGLKLRLVFTAVKRIISLQKTHTLVNPLPHTLQRCAYPLLTTLQGAVYLLVVDFLEYVLESSVVFLQNSVLCAVYRGPKVTLNKCEGID